MTEVTLAHKKAYKHNTIKKYFILFIVHFIISGTTYSQTSNIENSIELQLNNGSKGDIFIIDNIIYGCRVTKGDRFIFKIYESHITKLTFKDYHQNYYVNGKELKNEEKFNSIMSNQLFSYDKISKLEYQDFINKLAAELNKENSDSLSVSGDKSEIIIMLNNKVILKKEYDFWFALTIN
jgi:hypothetical protein